MVIPMIQQKTIAKRLKSLLLSLMIFFTPLIQASADEDIYRDLSRIARGTGDTSLFYTLNTASRGLDWENSDELNFEGHLRLLQAETITGSHDETALYLIRNINGDLHLLSMPPEEEILKQGEASPYFKLQEKMGNKLVFKVKQKKTVVNEETYSFVVLQNQPAQLFLDRIFKISIVIMLFSVMAGMGLTLTMNDFRLVFQKPKAIITGAGLQWIVMPLIAVALGYLMGFYQSYPFIFVGMVLITVSPGGVTSNLMTYYAKGDLALSISLTSFSTVLSLFFTPFLLALFCANVPEVKIPVGLVVQTIIVLVIIPLTIGMSVRARWPEFSKRATPFFSLLGILALLFLIIAGLLANLDMFTDTERYGIKYYSMVFLLTLLGMGSGAVISKLCGVNNYQTRAVSLETGLRNASLAMTIALLIQDHMGDFFSSMFFTSAIFGLWMYVVGFLSIVAFKRLLPLRDGAI
jgi:BASS family bile acid:Na+ symporter